MGYATPAETHRAAKQHRCDWCGEPIAVGETYQRWRWYGDGTISAVRSHQECVAAAHEAAAEWGSDEVTFNRSETRGCWCGHSAGCQTCASRKAPAVTQEA